MKTNPSLLSIVAMLLRKLFRELGVVGTAFVVALLLISFWPLIKQGPTWIERIPDYIEEVPEFVGALEEEYQHIDEAELANASQEDPVTTVANSAEEVTLQDAYEVGPSGLSVPLGSLLFVDLKADGTYFQVRDNTTPVFTVNADKEITTEDGSTLDIKGALEIDGSKGDSNQVVGINDSGQLAWLSGSDITAGNLSCDDCLDTDEIDDIYLLNTGDSGTGVFNFGSATSLQIPNGDSPTVDANGEIAFDNDVTGFTTGVFRVFGSDEELGIVTLPIDDFTSPTDGYVVAYDSTTEEFELVAQAGGGSSKWTDGGAVTYLTATTDAITIGGSSALAKLGVDGDADEIQLLVQGHSTQTSNLVVFENSSGTDQLTLTNSGNLAIAGDLTVTGDDITLTTNTSGAVLVGDGTNFNPVVIDTDLAIGSDGTATIQADSVALTTDTTGNYTATIADAGNSTITVVNGSAEGGAVTLDAVDLNCADCLDFTEFEDTLDLDAALTINTSGNNIVINEDGGDSDFRIEGDTEANLFFVDASAESIGIGNAVPLSSSYPGLEVGNVNDRGIVAVGTAQSGNNKSKTILQNVDPTYGASGRLGWNFVTNTSGTVGKFGSSYAAWAIYANANTDEFSIQHMPSGSTTVSDFLNIASSGNVGIGDDSPAAHLVVGSDSGAGLADGTGDVFFENDLEVDGLVQLDGVQAGTDNTVLVLNSSSQIVTDEIDSKVWDGSLLDQDGSGTDNEIALWTDGDSLEGDANFTFDGSTLSVTGSTTLDGAVTINDSGADVDFRVEGDTDTDLFFVDASTDRIGVSTNAPLVTMHVDGSSSSLLVGTSSLGPQIKATSKEYGWYGDGNTGLYNQGNADQLYMRAGGEVVFAVVEDDTQDTIEIGDDGDIDISLSAGADGALFVEGSSGNVGIGTSSPDNYLEIVSDDSVTAGGLTFDAGGGNEATRVSFKEGSTVRSYIERTRPDLTSGNLQVVNVGTGYIRLAVDGDDLYVASSGNTGIGGDDTPDATLEIVDLGSDILNISSSASGDGDYVTVDSGGRVIIGHTDSVNAYGTQSGFQIHGTGAEPFASLVRYSTSASDSPYLTLSRTRSTTVGTVGTVVSSGDQLGGIAFLGDDGTDLGTPAAEILGAVDGTPGSNDMPGRLVFKTTADGAASTTERMRIDSSGNVGIGDTSPTALLTVGSSDAFQVNSSGAVAAATGITSSGTITFSALDCTGNSNGGALTADASGVISCSDDDSGGGGGTLSGLSDTTVSSPSSGQILIYDGTDSWDNQSLSSDVTINSSGVATIAANAVALTTDTTGNYVASITNGTSITGGDGGSEGATLTLDVADDSIDFTELEDTLDLDAALAINTSGNNITINEDGGASDFRVEGDTEANLFFVDASADYVGIGTNSPGAELAIAGDIEFTNGAARTISVALSGTNEHDRHLILQAADNNKQDWRPGDLFLYAGDNTNGSSSIAGGDVIIQPGYTSAASASGVTGFNTGDGTRVVTIDGDGELGIGDTSPDDMLNVDGGTAESAIAITSEGTNTDALVKFELTDGTANFVVGVDDSDSDLFKIDTTALGAADLFQLNTSGDATVLGDLTVTGDDLFLTTNTDTAILVADGTNFNPVVPSGDIGLTNAGVFSIAADTIVEADLDVITGDTPADEECLTYESGAGGDFEWQSCGGGSSTLQDAYDSGNTIEILPATGSTIITETTATASQTTDLLQLTINPATGGDTSGDALQITLDAVDATSSTGAGLHIIVDQSQATGDLILAEDDAGTDLFRIEDDGATTISAAAAVTTALTITDTDFTNAISLGDNDITGTAYQLTATSGDLDFSSTSDGFNFTLGGGAGDDFIVDTTTLVVESDNDRVGIGTDSPSQELHVAGDIRIDSNDRIEFGSTSSYITFDGADLNFFSADDFQHRITGGGLFAIQNTTPQNLFYVNPNGFVYVRGAGGMMIGDDTSADAMLEIAETGTTPFMISNGINGDGDFFIVDASGNVGIGDATPDATFEVENTSLTADLALLTGSVAATNDGVDGLVVAHTLTDSTTSAGARVTVTNADNATAADTFYGVYVEVDDNSTLADDTAYGIYVNNPDQGAGTDADLTLDAFLYLNTAEDTAGVVMADGIILSSAGSVITDAIDVSDSDITNALNIGANDIAFSTGTLSASDLELLDDGAIALASEVSGVLPIANGGTNKALTLDAGGIFYSDADSFEVLGAGTSGQLLTSGGTGAPTWTSQGTGNGLDADTLDGVEGASFLRSDASDAYTSGTLTINDDLDLAFGSGNDWLIQYDEGVDDQLLFVTTGTTAFADTDPMFEILVGTTPDADQQVFGVAKGTQASNTALFTVDEGGDAVITGDLTVTGDDLFLTTNTDTAILVADGTNFNPVVPSGDIGLTNAGVFSIAADTIVEADLDVITGDTPADEECLTYESGAGGDFEWQSCGGGSSTLQDAYDSGNTIEILPATGSTIITETTATASQTTDLLQLTINPATGGDTSGDALQITLDAVDATSSTGAGLHIIVDQSQATGDLILAEDDAGTDLFRIEDDGATTISAAAAVTTALTITDTDFTNAISLGDNDITGTAYQLTATSGDLDFSSTSDGFNFTLGGGAGDDFIVDTTTLVVESDNDRVGIGTAGPSSKLEVVADGNNIDGITVTQDSGYPSASGALLLINSIYEVNNRNLVDIGSGGDSEFVIDNFGTVTIDHSVSNGEALHITQSSGFPSTNGLLYIDSTYTTTGRPLLAVNSGGNSRLYVDTDGNVGIGDTSPDDMLNVDGGTAESAIAITSEGTNTDALVKFELTDGTANFVVGVDDSDSDLFKIDTTALGAADLFQLNTSGDATVLGDLTVTGDDLFLTTNTDTAILVADGTNFNPVVPSGDIGLTNAGVFSIAADTIVEADLDVITGDTPADEECLTYESGAGGDFEWQSCGGGGGLWSNSGSVDYLTTTGNTVTIGSSTGLGKLAVDGDADEVQLLIQGHSTQTSNLVVFENSAGTDQMTLTNAGAMTLAGDLAVNGDDITSDGDLTITPAGGAITLALGGSAADDLIVDTTTLVVESDNNRVGVGTAAPDSSLEIEVGATGNQIGLTLDYDDTAGTDAAYIDSQTGDSHALLIEHAGDGNNSTTAGLRVTAESGGGAAYFYTNVGGGMDDALVEIVQNHASGDNPALFIDNNTQTAAGGQAIDIDAENTTSDIIDISAAVLTTGRVIDIPDVNALTSGHVLNLVGTSTAVSEGRFINIDWQASGSPLTDNTGALNRVYAKRDESRSDNSSTSDDYDVWHIHREDEVASLNAGFQALGSVLKLEKTTTDGDGTIDDQVMILEVLHNSLDTNVMQLADSDGTCDHNPEAGSVTVSCSSDIKLKEDVRDADLVLDDLMQLQIRDYTVIASGDTMTGLIAQEALEYAPELVSEGRDGTLMVEQISHWKVIKAIQELQYEILDLSDVVGVTATASLDVEKEGEVITDSLMARLTGLENRVNALEEGGVGTVAGITDDTAAQFKNSLLNDDVTFLGFLEVNNNAAVTGTLSVTDDVTLYANLVVDAVHVADALNVHGDTALFGNLDVAGDARMRGELTIDEQQAGVATIPRGADRVTVAFEEAYEHVPLAQATALGPIDGFWVSDYTREGFTIFVSAVQEEDVSFTWLTLSVEAPEEVHGEPIDENGNGIPDIDEQDSPEEDEEALESQEEESDENSDENDGNASENGSEETTDDVITDVITSGESDESANTSEEATEEDPEEIEQNTTQETATPLPGALILE